VAISLHNAAGNNAGTASSCSVTLTASVGEIVVVVVASEALTANPVRTVTSVTDSAGNTYTKRFGASQAPEPQWNSNEGFEVWWAYVANALSAATITANMSGTADAILVNAAGFQGFTGTAYQTAPWDTNAVLPDTAQATSTSLPSVTGVSTTSTDGMLLFGCCSGSYSLFVGPSIGPPTGFTLTSYYFLNAPVNALGSAVWHQAYSSAQSSITITNTGSSPTGWIAWADALTIPAGGAPTGTLATIEAADVAAFTGQLDGLGDISSVELTPRLRPSRGPMQRRIMPFSFDLPAVIPAEITGTLDTTEAADIAAFVGQVVIAATFDTTEAPDVAAFNGTVAWTGTLATTEAQDVAAFTGTVAWTGTLATTEAPDIAAFTGSAAWIGTLATTEAADVAAFNGTVAWTATLAVTEATDIAAFTGSAAWTGTLATTEAQDVAAFNGQVVISASLVVTEGQDVANFSGEGVGVSGTLATTEATDVAAFAGQVVIAATLATVEAADAAAFNGAVTWTGTLATTEAKDVMAFVGSAGWTGTLAVTEATDVAAFAGQVRINAALAVTEAADIAVFNGFLVAPVTGTLAVTEVQDTASFSGFLVFTGIVASLDAIERADGARFVVAQPPADPGVLQYGWPDVIVRRRL
jgi:hypothetical protein